MAEIKFNTLYDQMSGANQDFYDDTFTKYYDPNKAWTDQKNVLTMKTLPNQSTPNFDAMRTAYDQGAKSKTLGNFNWGSLVGMGSADAAMPTDAERAAINNTGIMGASGPNMRDISGEVGEYGNTSGFDLSNMNNPDAAIGPMINFKDAPVEWNEKLKGLQMNNPRYGLIDQFRNQGGDETTRKKFPGILSMMQSMFQGAGNKLGMTQVSDADKLANKQFMQDQGIGRDPQTGRMIGGDFEGKNAPGTSAWGSANFGEMAQKWDEEYGDMKYKTFEKQQQQRDMKKAAADYALKLEADKQERIRNERAQASAITARRDPTGGGASGRHMGNISQANAQAVAQANAAMGMSGWGLAYGGRVGYRKGGRVGILAAF